MHVTLEDRFALIDTIASGGMGKVYLARDLRDPYQPLAALKVLHPHLAEEREFVQMFIDEARVTTRLRHPHVVRIFDVERIGDNLVIVMEYVEGASLHEIQRILAVHERPMPIGFALRLVVDALAGLHFAHELVDEQTKKSLGIVHRDVSPQNVLVGTDGRARMGDFGVARWAHRIAQTHPSAPIRGKLRYLAPEQIQRKNVVDRRVDIFAAGIVLWECLTGRVLFRGDTESESVAAVLWEPIAPASVHRPELAQEIDDVCLRALEREPDRRYATALELATALERAAKTEIFSREQAGALVTELAAPTLSRRRAAIERVGAGQPPVKATPGVAFLAREATADLSARGGRAVYPAPAAVDGEGGRTPGGDAVRETRASSERPRDGALGAVGAPRRPRWTLASAVLASVVLLAAAAALGRASKGSASVEVTAPSESSSATPSAAPLPSSPSTTASSETDAERPDPLGPLEVEDTASPATAPKVVRHPPTSRPALPPSNKPERREGKTPFMPSHL